MQGSSSEGERSLTQFTLFGLFSSRRFAASGIFFILLLYFERKDPAPLLDLSLFKVRLLTAAVLSHFFRVAFAYFDVLSPAVLLARYFAIHADPGWIDDYFFLAGDRVSRAGRRLARGSAGGRACFAPWGRS